MKIAVVTPRYAVAGVPLAQIRFARAWAAAGHEVELLVGAVSPGFTMPDLPDLKVTLLGRKRVMAMVGPLVRYLRRERPDVVFTAEDHLTAITLLAAGLARSKAKVSGSSRVSPFDTYGGPALGKGWVLKRLMRRLMHRAAVLTCVSKDMVLQYRQVFPAAPHRWAYNIVGDAQSVARMDEPLDDPWLRGGEVPVVVAAGTLVPWKGFDDLLEAMALVVRRRAARLLILGDGPLRQDLQAKVDRLALGGHVRLVGSVANPLRYFRRSQVFALSSHLEGMPNVLVEAMMCGCTPVAVDCPTGPRELLADGKAGYLVPMRDANALAEGILRGLDHPIGREALQQAVQPFTPEAVLARHLDLLGLQPEVVQAVARGPA